MSKKNKWSSLLVVAMLGVLFLIAGCAQDTKDSGAKEKKQAAEAKTRTVTDDAGRKVEVPEKPKRIVTDWYMGQILALDVTPVGAPIYNLDYAAFLKDYYKEGTIDNISDGEISMEKVLELQPDLIITWDEKAVEKYGKIAPVIVFSDTGYKTVDDEIKAMGNYLDREKEAESFLKKYHERVNKAKNKIDKAISSDTTFTIFQLTDKKAHVVSPNGVLGGRALYNLMEMKAPQNVQNMFDSKESESGSFPISFETIGDYTADYVFELINSEQKIDYPVTWKSLDVVKNKETIPLDIKYFFAGDPVSAMHQAEEIADKIVEASAKKK